MRSFTFQSFKKAVENFVPPPENGTMAVNGTLSPSEFRRAGDELTARFGTWKWDGEMIVFQNATCRSRAQIRENHQDGFTCIQLDTDDDFESDDDFFAEPDWVVKTAPEPRRYTLSITYDKYYQTPRIWLQGVYNNLPLTPEQMLEDIDVAYANQTARIETHPVNRQVSVSIHPCGHANAILFMLQTISHPRVENYLVYFLKFLTTVVPTIEYDFTTDVS